MNISQLVESAKKAEPKLASLSDEVAKDLLAQVFQRIRDEIDGTEEGLVKVATLGRFRIRQGEREKDGQKVKVKRINFRPAKDK